MTKTAKDVLLEPVLIVGFGVSGQAVAKKLYEQEVEFIVIDDNPQAKVIEVATSMGISVIQPRDKIEFDEIIKKVGSIVVGPGIPSHHPIFSTKGHEIMGEVELAWRISDVPTIAITGTNGKTTVTTLVTAMLQRSGFKAVAAGNIGTPFIKVANDNLDFIVLEVSSFQLFLTTTFKPVIGTWLNISPDHLDWHHTMQDYIQAKFNIWKAQDIQDLAIANFDDEIVRSKVELIKSKVVFFSTNPNNLGKSYCLDKGMLVNPNHQAIVEIDTLPRRLPHDLVNDLASIATAMEAGASLESCREVLTEFNGLSHRVEFLGSYHDVKYFNDSKATTPASVSAALKGFDSVVLIAGGKNKGLSLEPLLEEASRLRHVVAIGEASSELEKIFENICPVVTAHSMDEAVNLASCYAKAGDSILLSPGCTSYDWYGSYVERGNDFSRAVRAQIGKEK